MEKWIKVGKSWKKWGKVGKSGEKLGKGGGKVQGIRLEASGKFARLPWKFPKYESRSL